MIPWATSSNVFITYELVDYGIMFEKGISDKSNRHIQIKKHDWAPVEFGT